ncbi:esterase-like activity of phytase family protein [Hymenobacter nivis]|uniref:esterase-like activity of phytase family protein n=1 Tax=Hymenobacter nivis TaxID=1850093 RepID=UPI001FE64EF7|nr:esterase-like activity of phytase family protein [Hymenobacter nivis]
MYWTSEGDPARRLDPFVREMNTTGAFHRTLPALPQFHFTGAPDRGPLGNATYESLARTPGGPAGAPYSPRLSQLDARSGALLYQYACVLDPVIQPGRINRMSETRGRERPRVLTIECFYASVGGVQTRIYAVDTRAATDMRARLALAGGPYRPVRKRLVADLGALASRLDNLEGLAFGPPLPNGHRTLVVVADNNFSANEANQFLAFEVLP